ncbi:MAG: restriction endonuclease subunit S [Myxococcales bacterium]
MGPGWSTVRLRDVVEDISYGFTASASEVANGPKMLRITDIQDNRVEWASVPRCECDHPARYLLRAGDIVIARTGATTGKSFLLTEVSEPSVFASYLIRVQPSASVVPEYLANYMLSPTYWAQIMTVSKGTAQPGANASILGGLELPLPPLNEQRRIVAKLESLQARSRRARQALDTVPSLLEKLRQSVLAAAFRGDLTKDWRAKHPDVEPASKLLERIRVERRKKWEESELAKMKAKGKAPTDDKWKAKYKEPEAVDATGLAELPVGWCWASVEEIASLVTGGTPPGKEEGCYGGTIPFLKPTDLDRGRDVGKARQYLTEAGASFLEVLPVGTVLITCIGATIGKTGLARVACTTNQQINAAVPVLVESEYLYWWVVGPAAQRWIVGHASATTLPILNKGRLAGMPVPLAPHAEQRPLCTSLNAASAHWAECLAVLDDVASRLCKLDMSTLAKAFRGELVPQDPTDEPADAMLARGRGTAGATRKPGRGKRGVNG